MTEKLFGQLEEKSNLTDVILLFLKTRNDCRFKQYSFLTHNYFSRIFLIMRKTATFIYNIC